MLFSKTIILKEAGKFSAYIIIFFSLLNSLLYSQNWQYYDSLRTHYQEIRLLDSALFFAEKALDFVNKNYHDNDTLIADMKREVFMAYYFMGDYETAVEYGIKEREIRLRSQGAEHHLYASCLNNLASMYRLMGQYDKALPLFIEGIDLFARTRGKEDEEYGVLLNNLASLYRDLGQYDNALPLALEALQRVEAHSGKENPYYSMCLNNLALLYLRIGQYERSLPLYLEALEITETTHGKEHPTYGIRLNNLAMVYSRMGDYEKALILYEEALVNAKNSLGENHHVYGARLSNLGYVYSVLKKYDKALPLYLEALENTGRTLGKEHYAYGIRLNNLARLYGDMGNYEEALKTQFKTLEVYEKSIGKEHSSYGIALNNLVRIYDYMSKPDLAFPVIREAIDNCFFNIYRVFTFLSESEKENFINTMQSDFNSFHNFFYKYYDDYPELAAEAFNIEIATKGMILQSGIQMRQTILNSGDQHALELYDEWFSIRSEIAKQYALPINERKTDLPVIEQQAERLEGELMRLSHAFKQIQSINNITWKDVQKGLKPDEIVIEFSSFRYHEGNNVTDSTIYVALVLGAGYEHPIMVRLFEERQLEDIIGKIYANDYEYINNIYGRNNFRPHYAVSLYELIWEPLQDLLENIERIYISPSGLLYKISFSALSIKENLYLSDLYDLQLRANLEKVEERVESFNVRNASLYGGINYNTKYCEIEVWPYLEGTLQEVKLLKQLLENADVDVNIFTGENATEEEFKKASGDSDILHIATHGFFYPDPEIAAIDRREIIIPGEVIFRGGEQGYGVWSFKENPNPLMRSGLIFAGANNVWSIKERDSNKDDGVLTAQEVTQLDLRNTSLVVLSACETGLGDIRGSEGVYGLQRAFKMAGVKNIIMTLWQVPDNETVEFMEIFYSKLLEIKDVRIAFNKTQREMRLKYDPFFWAAFILIE